MRSFSLPLIQKRPVNLETTDSMDFLGEIAPHKTVHFQNRSGIVQVAEKMPEHMERAIKRMSRDTDTPEMSALLRRDFQKKISEGTRGTSRFITSLHSAFAKQWHP